MSGYLRYTTVSMAEGWISLTRRFEKHMVNKQVECVTQYLEHQPWCVVLRMNPWEIGHLL